MFVIHHTIIRCLLNIPRHFKLIVFWLANFMIDFNATRSLFWSHIKSSFRKPLQHIVVWFFFRGVNVNRSEREFITKIRFFHTPLSMVLKNGLIFVPHFLLSLLQKPESTIQNSIYCTIIFANHLHFSNCTCSSSSKNRSVTFSYSALPWHIQYTKFMQQNCIIIIKYLIL